MIHGHLDYFQEPPLGGGPNTWSGNHGTPNAHNRWFIPFYHVWGHAWIETHWNSNWLRPQSHMTSHYTWGSVTTLRDCGGVLRRGPSYTFINLGSHNFMVTALGSCVKWPQVSSKVPVGESAHSTGRGGQGRGPYQTISWPCVAPSKSSWRAFEIAFGWGPGHIWLHITFEGPWPHYVIVEVCWDGDVWTLSFGLSQFHGHGSWLVCEVAPKCPVRFPWESRHIPQGGTPRVGPLPNTFLTMCCTLQAQLEGIWNSIWLRAWSHMTSHYTLWSVTTLPDCGGVLGRGRLDTFIWALTISWSRLLARVWSGPKCRVIQVPVGELSAHSTRRAGPLPSTFLTMCCGLQAQGLFCPPIM
jgi:hypothetical protein